MGAVQKCLKDDSIFLLHTIGNSHSQVTGDLWVHKYIFPKSMIPSLKQISEAVEGFFVIEDVHIFGACYDTILSRWLDNFEGNCDKLKDMYDEKFHLMWRYYLQMFIGAFRSRYLQVWHIVLSRKGIDGGYSVVL
jgi:cyclopropane-fatty-acyl-phospholipid synthase